MSPETQPGTSATQVAPGAAPASSGGEGRGELLIQTVQAKDTAILYVSDTGVGIPADNLPRVFDAYFTTKKGGTGLGLPTTRRIIEEHGGHITVQSEPGKGTSFRVELPRVP
jgi:signal transduction histidine kinase